MKILFSQKASAKGKLFCNIFVYYRVQVSRRGRFMQNLSHEVHNFLLGMTSIYNQTLWRTAIFNHSKTKFLWQQYLLVITFSFSDNKIVGLMRSVFFFIYMKRITETDFWVERQESSSGTQCTILSYFTFFVHKIISSSYKLRNGLFCKLWKIANKDCIVSLPDISTQLMIFYCYRKYGM